VEYRYLTLEGTYSRPGLIISYASFKGDDGSRVCRVQGFDGTKHMIHRDYLTLLRKGSK